MKKKGIEVPPAVCRPLIGEDGNSQIKDAVLQFVLGVTSALPESVLPEFAFAGKSNVGKSSLLNALVNRKALARTSAQPGKTQTINFYRVNGAVYFVDLPGYGYAKVSQELRQKWGKMIERYITTSPTLKLICLLVDIRHEPTENDKLMYDWIKYHGYKVLLILTKADKLKRSVLNKHIKMIEKALKVADEDMVVAFSSESKQGREEVYEIISNMSVS
ncbi:ribosome biogenesis GTP-binding protein YihA/YsxC [uncultured Campylobacter sp.]|uniref:ribosome biogenesis GTP-binding protein YihA/YsxC n=1 Tax=uncultured Campylobacter sp. TaxID=218934 RepID=UPI00260A7C31|nr:ribosome biogenesis GTP-binding protein YihA/YsxC [uncultured Campylobacter sp.]